MLLGQKDTMPVLLSIPRDTMIQTDYGIDKLNAIYAVNGGGNNGISALNNVLYNQFGILPQRYILVDLTAFEQLVNAIGGVWYDVPEAMQYSDPTQDLLIDLTSGYQNLNGNQALGLVRYRNYFLGDIDRIQIQQSLLRAVAKQLQDGLTSKRILQLATIFMQYVRTDLNLAETVNLARLYFECDLDQIIFGTLPGGGMQLDGIDYYCLDDDSVKAMIADMFTDYIEERINE